MTRRMNNAAESVGCTEPSQTGFSSERDSGEIALSIVVPCYNEEENLSLLVARTEEALRSCGIDGYEIVLVDDASQDQTWDVICSLARLHQVIIPVRHSANRGIVGGWRSGLARSHGRIVLTTDADLQYAPEDIPLLYQECKKGPWDLVQGWRQRYEEKDRLRQRLSNSLSIILRTLFSMDLQDVKSGFIAYHREVLEDILDYRFRYTSFEILPTVAAHFKGYRIKQIPVTFHKRHAGESFIKRPFLFSARMAMDLPKAIVEYRLSRSRRSRRNLRHPGETGKRSDCMVNEN